MARGKIPYRAMGSSETSGAAKRALVTVVDIRKEIVAKYREVDRNQRPANEGYCMTQMLMNAAKLMTETEPEIEVRKLNEENAALREELTALKAEMDQIRNSPQWAFSRQLEKPAAQPLS